MIFLPALKLWPNLGQFFSQSDDSTRSCILASDVESQSQHICDYVGHGSAVTLLFKMFSLLSDSHQI